MAILDLTGGKLDLVIKAGDDPVFFLPTPVDLTTWTWAAQIRDSGGALQGSFDLTVTSAGARCLIHHAVTRNLPKTTKFDIQVSLAGEQVTTLLSGQITTSQDVTV